MLNVAIWALCVLHFLLRVVHATRADRGVRLIRVISSAYRGIRTLGRMMGRCGPFYVLALTLLVNLRGAAGILTIERESVGGRINGYGSALWWTAMTLTTMSTDVFPLPPEERLLGLLLAMRSSRSTGARGFSCSVWGDGATVGGGRRQCSSNSLFEVVPQGPRPTAPTRSIICSVRRLSSSRATVASARSCPSRSNLTASAESSSVPSTRVASQDSACPT